LFSTFSYYVGVRIHSGTLISGAFAPETKRPHAAVLC